MTAVVRYKSVTNDTGAPLTSAGVPSGDGSDKLYRVIQRILSEDDIGEDPGQTKNASGCIVDVLPSGTNVLCIEGSSFVFQDGEWSRLDNKNPPALGELGIISYFVDANNNVCVTDRGTEENFTAGNLVIIKLIFGPN